MQHPIRDSLIIGFAMFSVFFGAGNLIFPPQIGITAGDQWEIALIGLVATGMILPVLGVIAIGLNGGDFEKLTRPIAPWFGTVLIFTTMIAIAWLITIPRTASVAYETGIMTLAPSLNHNIGLWIFLPLYFVTSLYFAIDQNKVIERLGAYLTPALVALLIIIVFWAVFAPLGKPVPTAETAPFYLGFTTGYQTGDVFTGLLFGVIFLKAIRESGYSDTAGFNKVMLGVSLVTLLGLFVVYGGLEYLGATGTGLGLAVTSPAELLSRLVYELAGSTGAIALATAVLLACLTTCIGATAVMAGYITKWTKDRISYRVAVLITTLVAGAQSFGGVNYIIGIAGPIFMLFYPVGICIVVLGLASKVLRNDGVWKGTALLAIVIGAYDCASILSQMLGFKIPSSITSLYDMIPLASSGFAWVVPSIIGGIVGGFIWKASGRNNVHDALA